MNHRRLSKVRSLHKYGVVDSCFCEALIEGESGSSSYKGVIKREAVYKCTNKDYLPEAEPRANDHFTCKAKPSKGKMHCQ